MAPDWISDLGSSHQPLRSSQNMLINVLILLMELLSQPSVCHTICAPEVEVTGLGTWTYLNTEKKNGE